MSVFALDTDGDLKIVNGRTVRLTGPEETAQKLDDRLEFVRGEWFLDTSAGFPLFENVLVKSPDLDAIKRIYASVIEGTVGVRRILDLTVAIVDRAARKLDVDYRIEHDTGAVIVGGLGKPYVVTPSPGAT